MKKFISLSLVAIFSIGVVVAVACSDSLDDRPIAVNELPKQITEFVDTHFAGAKISYAKKDVEFGKVEYEVVLSNGTQVEFNSKGEWTDVNCERGEVPASVVPAKIADYVAEHFANTHIEKISRSRGYEVELNNDLELHFDKEFNFLRIDD